MGWFSNYDTISISMLTAYNWHIIITMIQIQHGQVSDPTIPTSGGGCLLIVLVVLAEARPGRFPGWLIGCFRCFLLPSGERSSPLWWPLMSRSSLWCSPLVPVVHQSWGLIIPVTAAVLERSTLASPPFVLIPRCYFCMSRLSDRGCWGKPLERYYR